MPGRSSLPVSPCALHDVGSGIDNYLLNSVYGWACHDGLAGDVEVTGSERLIGWLTLLVKIRAMYYARTATLVL